MSRGMTADDADRLICEIAELFARQGREMYAGEPVTQTEHALQSAWQAEQDAASASLVAAALLHDVGHLLHDLGEDCAEEGIDDQHEARGADWLGRHFGADVVEPVRLHVAAKRYRCAVDSAYHARLSDASRLSLKLQGGPFTESQARGFERHPYFQDAVRLRLWDEAAKIPNLETPPLEHFLNVVRKAITREPLGA
jgi:[1-hydroxy-2-(trimethylamino)ethyl]phosphonate dioxygenase